jgi:hypothetical protein
MNYCKFCYLVIAPFDPMKTEHEGKPVHSNCLKEFAKKQFTPPPKPLPVERWRNV